MCGKNSIAEVSAEV